MNNGDFTYNVCTSCNWWILALDCLSSVSDLSDGMIAVDLLNNDDIYVTSNWWGQSWGPSSEPVRLTKYGASPTPSRK